MTTIGYVTTTINWLGFFSALIGLVFIFDKVYNITQLYKEDYTISKV
jgi:hypothetical protein